MSAIGNEYGNAIFLLAEEEGKLDEVMAGLDVCREIFGGNPQYVDFLETPSIPIEERLEAVRSAFDGKMPECVTDFVSLLTERGYIHFFPDCVETFENEYNRRFDIAVADAVSAKPLSVEERQSLRDMLERKTGRRIKLNCEVDPELVGGLVVKIDGKLYDGSIRSRITDILEEMTK
ncbi:MAG: ATP synthase F1 subunit delta [Clostridia bacterium]|nr:ATP synthase F1 subunit delta [Clostridia bacterium]